MSQWDYKNGLDGGSGPLFGKEEIRDWEEGSKARDANENLAKRIRGEEDTSGYYGGQESSPAFDSFIMGVLGFFEFIVKGCAVIAVLFFFSLFATCSIVSCAVASRLS